MCVSCGSLRLLEHIFKCICADSGQIIFLKSSEKCQITFEEFQPSSGGVGNWIVVDLLLISIGRRVWRHHSFVCCCRRCRRGRRRRRSFCLHIGKPVWTVCRHHVITSRKESNFSPIVFPIGRTLVGHGRHIFRRQVLQVLKELEGTIPVSVLAGLCWRIEEIAPVVIDRRGLLKQVVQLLFILLLLLLLLFGRRWGGLFNLSLDQTAPATLTECCHHSFFIHPFCSIVSKGFCIRWKNKINKRNELMASSSNLRHQMIIF